jgi:hypothetical protein
VKLHAAENQIIIDSEVYARRPNDSNPLMPAIEVHAAKLGCIPRLVAADAGFYSGKNEATTTAKGADRVCIPNRASKSAAQDSGDDLVHQTDFRNDAGCSDRDAFSASPRSYRVFAHTLTLGALC